MIISHKHRFIYLAPVKTGTTSIISVLSTQYEAYVYTEIDFGVGNFQHDIGLPKEFEDYFVWASVRNPYSRAISAYNFANKSQMAPIPIQEAMTDPPLLRSLYDTLFNNPTQEGCVPVRLDSYVKLENLEADFARLPFAKPTEFPFENVTDKKFIEELDYHGIAYVQRHYRKDFDYFGYDPLPTVFKLYL